MLTGSCLEVLRELGSSHVLVVAAEDGLDEISNSSATTIESYKTGKFLCSSLLKFGVDRINSHEVFKLICRCYFSHIEKSINTS